MLENSGVAELLVASQQGLSSMEFVIWLVLWLIGYCIKTATAKEIDLFVNLYVISFNIWH
jgi:hypothetical protein